MSALKLIDRDDQPPRQPPSTPAWGHRWRPLSSIMTMALLVVLAGIVGLMVWWWANEDTRAIQLLPDEQRIPLYHRTIDNLRNICDPAASRSLRDFCHGEADRALRFRECDSDPQCQELARRHLPQPHR